MAPVLIVPGISNSGPAHWQSRWEALHPGCRRVAQRDWDHPVCDDWVQALAAAVAGCSEPPVIVAHSLGCLAVAHWAARQALPVRRLMLVAVPDPGGPAFPPQARGFAPVPATLGGLPATVVSSNDDPYASPSFTAHCVQAWGAEHVSLGAAGHVNAASGLGDWPAGWALVQRWR